MKLLLTGGTGLVGSRFLKLNSNIFEVAAPSSSELDISNPRKVEDFFAKINPEVVVNLAAYTNVDAAEEEADDEGGMVFRLNALAPENLARICRQKGIHFVQVSTDYVFDGKKENEPYKEEDPVNPVNWYGKTKQLGEQFVLDVNPEAAIARIERPYSSMFNKRSDFARFFYDSLKSGKPVNSPNDQKVTPVFVDSAVNAFMKLAETKSEGIYHIATKDYTTPFDFALKIAKRLGFDKGLINPVSFEDFNNSREIPRPKNCWLDTKKFDDKFPGILLTVDESIDKFCAQIS